MPSVGIVESRRRVVASCEVCVTVLLAVALLVPLVVVPGTFFPYVVPRNLLFRVAVELAAAIRITELFAGGQRFDFRREYVLWALTAFLLAIALSTVFSAARPHSLFGDFERMGGVWAWLHLGGFLLLLRTIRERHLTWLLHVALAAGLVASMHAIVQRFSGADPITLAGNAGLLAGYLLVSLAIPLYLATRIDRYRWLYLLAAGIELLAILTAQNRSTVIGLIVGGVVAALTVGFGRDLRTRRWIPLGVAAGVVAGVLGMVVVLRAVGTADIPFRVPAVLPRIAATDFDGLDALRAFQWKAAVAGFRERPLFGFGPENHHLVWSATFDPRSEQFGIDVFDRAHNQYLELLATTGIVGAVTFLAIWGATAYSLYRAFAARHLTVAGLAIFGGANVAYATYLIFWFVDINAAIVWMLLAAVISARCKPGNALRVSERGVSPPLALAGVVVTGAALALILHRQAYAPMRANLALATLDAYDGDRDHALAAIETIATSRANQTSHFGPVLSGFVRKARGERQAATVDADTDAEQLDRAFGIAIAAFDAELRRDPLNDRLHTAAGQLLIEAWTFYDSDAFRERAIGLLERAVVLNPRRSQQRRLLARVRSDSAVVRASGN